MILVSSCLGGIECRYNGSHAASEKIRRLVEEKKAVMVCPELLGGFTTPREPAEIIGGDGRRRAERNSKNRNGIRRRRYGFIYGWRGKNVSIRKRNRRRNGHP